VRVPYSYFVTSFKTKYHSAKDPDEKQLQPAIAEELALMQKAVANLLTLSSTDKVSIGTYADVAPESDVQPALAGTGVSSVSVMVGGHAKEIALGTLAVMSLFMASMMVRKGTPAMVPASSTYTPPPQQPTLLPGEAFVGEAASGGAALDGMELNDDTIKAQQMVEQVSTLVRDNPDAAASLVKRWLNRN